MLWTRERSVDREEKELVFEEDMGSEYNPRESFHNFF